MSELRIRTALEPMGPAGAIVLTDEQVAALSTAKAFPVAVTIGASTARLRLARMGGKNLIGFSKANRSAMGVELGAEFDAVIVADTAERTVEVPEALAAALADAGLTAVYEGLSFTRRKEIAVAVADAKQETTRDRRIAKAVDELRG
ncbi:YdeI/OmpD-associated family protein [Microbacterium capsulatum]|uniref:YdeI/OmpD-associated family protein n=1 Tax=Microbacterium capsulatum TaxID=3041921 RepID=A0ABU0XKQ5_9MICO|nr:YdeI/OmpD-associated family protein [Microbacterium sp. ASV81]MDQ4215727.1 YdeI/OmpD-associated family protein [Microbacterium sp. ASV81]